MDRIQDIDYLYASTRIRSLERALITRERLRRIAESKTDEEALKVLEECGYEAMSDIAQIPDAIAEKRRCVLDDILKMAPDKRIVKIFLLRYDYHNLKAILKGEAANTEYMSTLIDTGHIAVKRLIASTGNTIIGSDGEMTSIMKQAANEARDLLARTGDPRLSDTVLDRACFAEMLKLAQETQSKFLVEYIKLQIDSINLRTVVRLKRMKQDSMLIGKYFIEGGNISAARLKVDITPESLISIYECTPLRATASAAAEALRGETGLAPVDTEAENALLNYLKNAKYIAFGEQHIAAYIAAIEAEFTAINMVMASRKAGLSPEDAMERLRDTYV